VSDITVKNKEIDERRTGKDRRRIDAPPYSGPERRISGRRISDNVEKAFEKTGYWLYKNPLKVLFICFIFIGVLLYQLPKLTVDTSTESLLHKTDQSRLEYNAFRDQFGRAEMIIIAIKPPDVFNADFLNKLKSFQNDLEAEVPYLREVNTLINARSTRGEGDTLIVGELLEDWPQKSIDLASLKKRVMTNPVYLNNIISQDGSVTAVVIETEAVIAQEGDKEALFDAFEDTTLVDEDEQVREKPAEVRYISEKENREIVEAVQNIMDRYNGADFSLALAGGPVITDIFNASTWADIEKSMTLSILVNAFFLAILFRRLSGIILPLFIIVLSMFSTIGLMALFNIPFKLTTNVIPGFLIAVGLADSVHILAIFYRRLDLGSSKKEAIAYAMGHSGQAIVMTSLTTAAGVLSFSFAELTAIAEMGVFAAIGVVLALLFTVIMLPALLALTPIKQKTGSAKRSNLMDRILLFFVDFSTTHPGKIIVVCPVIFLVSVVFISQLRFSDNLVEFFPDKSRIKHDIIFIDKELNGMMALEAVIDTKRENGIYEPDVLNKIEKFSHMVENIKTDEIYVGKVFSINDILKEINQALHKNDPSYYSIPQDKDTVAQEFLLFENSGSDDLERIVDSQFSKTRITIKTPWTDSVVYEKFIDDIAGMFHEVFQDKAQIILTGEMALMARTIPATLNSMAKSYVAAFLVITIMMILLVENIKLGLLSMVPNLLPIIFTMGLIGLAGLSLNMNTLMIGSIAIGLVVDDTVHFMHNFRRYYDKTGDSYAAIRATLLGTGRALLITTLVLSSGFFVLTVASMKNFVQFGLFTGITIIFALLADFLVAPALMVLITQNDKPA
jgi:predicted RND superfamily exporter protein